MNRLIQFVLNKYASETDVSPEKKLDMLINILTIYLKSKNGNKDVE